MRAVVFIATLATCSVALGSPSDPRLSPRDREIEARGFAAGKAPAPVAARRRETRVVGPGVRRLRGVRPPIVAGLGGRATHLYSASKPAGALTGKTIYLSPGHGWTYTSNGWGTQRPNTHGIVEDLSNGDGVVQFLVPYLLAAGAQIVPVREIDPNPALAIADNDDGAPSYKETGDKALFSTSTQKGWSTPTWPMTGTVNPFTRGTNRLIATATSETARATFTFDVPASGYYTVQVSYSMFNTRPSDAEFIVVHPGGKTTFLVDQRKHGGTWVLLGRFYFDKGRDEAKGAVIVSNRSADAGTYVSVDAVRIGGGTGLIDRGGGTSKYPRADECSRYHAQFAGAPNTVYNPSASSDRSDDVTTRSRFADWAHPDGEDAVYISHHTNASGAGTARGTVTYLYGSNPPNGTLNPDPRVVALGAVDLAKAVHDSMVSDIRNVVDPNWRDRGVHSAYFGEVNPSQQNEMAAILIETAFHDQPDDAAHLRDIPFRQLVARSIYQGIVRYFAKRDGSPVALLPEPPRAVVAQNDGQGNVTVSWSEPPSGAPYGDAATSYRVYRSSHGYAFDNGTDSGGKTSLKIDKLKPGTLLFLRVTAVNDGGESLPTRTLAVRVASAGRTTTLLVTGYPRLDDGLNIKRDYPRLGSTHRLLLDRINDGTYAVQHGRALADAGVAFDGALDEAVASAAVDLSRYKLAVWQGGNGFDDQRAISYASTVQLAQAAQAGLSLVVSGTSFARGLAAGGADAQTLLNEGLRAAPGTGANTLDVSAAPGGLLDGIADWSLAGADGLPYGSAPEVLAAAGGSDVIARYLAGGGSADAPAAVAYRDARRCAVTLGFAFETIKGADKRATLMKRITEFCRAGASDPDGGPAPSDAGPGTDGGVGDGGDGGKKDGDGGCCDVAGRDASTTPLALVLLFAAALALGRRRRRCRQQQRR